MYYTYMKGMMKLHPAGWSILNKITEILKAQSNFLDSLYDFINSDVISAETKNMAPKVCSKLKNSYPKILPMGLTHKHKIKKAAGSVSCRLTILIWLSGVN